MVLILTKEDFECAKCGVYSGGATLCRKCEKAALEELKKKLLKKGKK